MANMGGSYKGNSSGNRGRPYGFMLLLAFGAALLGVMVLHKFRERRIFNLLVKEKDSELISLHLLLQREREYTKEVKRKTEEMKAKIYSLRTQKMELDRHLLEMQSTIESLKDEQRTMELALEEQQNEIKMLRAKDIDLAKENSQVIALTESLKQKDAEIEDLKHRVKVWSVSTDDPSNPPVNLTVIMEQKEKTEVSESEEEAKRFHESTNYRDSENTTGGEEGSLNVVTKFREGDDIARVEDGNQNRLGSADMMKMSREEELQKLENLQEHDFENGRATREKGFDDGQERKSEYSQNSGAYRAAKEKNIANETEVVVNTGGKVWKTRDEDSEVKSMDGEEHNTTGNVQLGKLETSQEGEGQDLRVTSKVGMKLEMPDNSASAGSVMRGKHGHASRMRGKRWRILAKNRLPENYGNFENFGGENMRSRKLSNDDRDGLKGTKDGAGPNGGKTERRVTGENNPQKERKAVDSLNVKSRKPQNTEDAENLKNKIGEASDVTSDGKKEILDEVRQPEDQEDTNMKEKINSRNINIVENSAEQVKAANKHEVPEDQEVADIQEPDFFRESSSILEEDDEDYREETDESEY